MTRELIPEAALDKHIALLGQNGCGKTSVAKVTIIEPALAAGERVINIDPTGVGWGLRLKKDGHSAAFEIPIFGGLHADYPLRTQDAALLAETYGTMRGSAIFDTSEMTVEDRTTWFTKFAETLLRKNKGKLKLVIDEAHLFMPQAGAKSGGGVPKMLHAGNNLVSLGRSRGLRITMITQRPAKLHKDSLSQAKTLVAMQMMAPQDREAAEDWIADQADKKTGTAIIQSLPGLQPGEGWVWFPTGQFLERVKFPRPKTFDSSSAPDDDNMEGPKLAPINLDALKGKLATVEAERKASDPKELRAEVAKLKAERTTLETQVAAASNKTTKADPDVIKKAEERGFEQAKRKLTAKIEREARAKIVAGMEAVQTILAPIATALDAAIKEARKERLSADIEFQVAPSAPVLAIPRRGHVAPLLVPKPRPHVNGGGDQSPLTRPLQRIVDSIRWWNVLAIAEPSQSQVAFVAGYSHKSGTWATYLSQLRAQALIQGSGTLTLTDSGLALANDPAMPPTAEHLRAAVMQKLDAPLQRILAPIIEAYPDALSQENAGNLAGYSSTSGTWATYLSRLRSLDIIEGRGELKAQDWLFP